MTYKRLARLSARIERREGKKMRMRTLMVGGVVLAVTAVLDPAASLAARLQGFVIRL